jgi:hypothetical protein
VDGFIQASAGRSTCSPMNAARECAQCVALWQGAMSSAGRQTSLRVWRACGPSRCTMPLAPPKIHPCDDE